MTDFNEWKERMNKKFNDEIATPKGLTVATTRMTFSAQTHAIEMPTGDIIEFKMRLLPKHQRLLYSIKKNEDTVDYDAVQDAMATVVADLCVDKSYDKEFWISLDEETGELSTLFGIIVEKITESEKSGESFRKDR